MIGHDDIGQVAMEQIALNAHGEMPAVIGVRTAGVCPPRFAEQAIQTIVSLVTDHGDSDGNSASV